MTVTATEAAAAMAHNDDDVATSTQANKKHANNGEFSITIFTRFLAHFRKRQNPHLRLFQGYSVSQLFSAQIDGFNSI